MNHQAQHLCMQFYFITLVFEQFGKPIAHLNGALNGALDALCVQVGSVQDEEWAELERMLRNSSDFRPESLRETHNDLTKGDIRTYILSHLQFSVSEQAILLGISPASVTKARQRLKAKLL